MNRIAKVEVDEGIGIDCFCPSSVAIHQDDLCIAEIDGGLEFGRVVSISELAEGQDVGDGKCKIVRQATLQDQAKAKDNSLRSKMAKDTCLQKAEKAEIELRIVRVRFNFDRSVLHILFAAAEHIDTHELIKELASELSARIDMKQIGVRDEAGYIGGMGPCGRQMCCCSWLSNFETVNVKMAKAQRLSLNPNAISGNCGRLKCCLRYEYNLYKELGKHIPRQGAHVECASGEGCVIGRNILAQKVTVSLDNDRVAEYEASEVKECWKKRPQNRRSGDENSRSERPES